MKNKTQIDNKFNRTALKYIFRVCAFSVMLLLAVLASCNKHPEGENDTETSTSVLNGEETDGIISSDVPKTEEYITFSDLTLPVYTFTSDDPDNNGIIPSTRDVWQDTWTATDGADRSMPSSSETKTPTDRQVGIFYFLWRDQDQSTLNPISVTDHNAAYLEGGTEKLWEVMQEGGEGHPHYWAEPYFGYYSSNDEWVLRRHAYMFADAGIDFVFFDTSNNNLHTVSHMALLKVWEEVRQEGYDVPKICFLVGSFDEEFNELYESIYAKGLYEDLWFYWNGKPLVMLTGDVNMTNEQKDFFTVRYSWAVGATNWYQERKGAACWPWSDDYPQALGYAEDGKTVEQMVVMCGSGAMTGRSTVPRQHIQYEGNWNFGYALMNTTTPLGLMFSNHFERALREDPPLLMITGWNEWIAGRWSGAGAGAGGVGMTVAGEYVVSSDPEDKESSYFIDQFNPEYSRDIEPMKGGFGDNYYYQMAEYIRTYKGSREIESAFGQWAIDINGSVGQWYAVGPEYRDYEGDTTDRLSPGHVGGNEYGMYVNFSGRNDIVLAKVSTDSNYLYFYVECAEDITDPEGTNWMNLFINADCDDNTGWYGYDYLINRSQDGNTVSVDRFVGKDTWQLESAGRAEYVRNGKILQIKLEKSLIGFEDTMDFKWADNSIPTKDIMEFLDQGDAAPNGRYNYRFTLKETESKIPDVLSEDMVVLKSRSYNAFVNGKSVRIVDDNTNGVLLASDHDIWLPVSFLEDYLNISCDGANKTNHYGIEYVKANSLIEDAGKKITVCSDGLVVIADSIIEDETVLRTLYNSLM